MPPPNGDRMSDPSKPEPSKPEIKATERRPKPELEQELAKLKAELDAVKAKENVVVGGGKKLGNINKKPVYCGHNCPKCPITIKEEQGVKVQIGHVAVQYLKDPDTHQVIGLQCKTLKSL